MAVVTLVIVSILLAVLIYTKSGYIGEHLSPMLGGIFGFIKYIIPIGTFAMAISIVYDDKEYIYTKLIQYVGLLICIMVTMSVYQVSRGALDVSSDINKIVSQSYELGSDNIGGGVVGSVIASWLIGLIGQLGTVILMLGLRSNCTCIYARNKAFRNSS